ncbi:hypothetical protein NC651_024822 [Populus alba x Populus x berolinensis]|nr:hypothetical protein NC651_024817 [Populus alba x Populus x berolinensis]KAJ6891439.1 hypothetical protein NC651_024822 [Populus alba x Populus x berolinensis]
MIKQRRLPLAAISINHKVLPTPPSLATDKTGVASGPRHLLLSLSFSFHRCKGRGAHNRMKKSFRNHAWLDTIIYNLSNVLLNYFRAPSSQHHTTRSSKINLLAFTPQNQIYHILTKPESRPKGQRLPTLSIQ